jgi:hypothetical protein
VTPVARLAAFVLALGLLFGASFAVGAAVGPDVTTSERPADTDHGEHDDGTEHGQ